eukprot:4812860-Alexandrium_andersonii.AAC.1
MGRCPPPARVGCACRFLAAGRLHGPRLPGCGHRLPLADYGWHFAAAVASRRLPMALQRSAARLL